MTDEGFDDLLAQFEEAEVTLDLGDGIELDVQLGSLAEEGAIAEIFNEDIEELDEEV